MTCVVENCWLPSYARGHCSKHYQQLRRRELGFVARPPRTCGTGNKSTSLTPLAQRLRDLRQTNHLSITEVARLLTTGENRVTDWEIGINTPTLPTLRRYAAVFGLTVAQLLDGVM